MQEAIEIINQLISECTSARKFAKRIGCDIAEVIRWRKGVRKVRVKAVVKIVEIWNISPHILRPDIFPANLTFIFK